MDARTTRVTVVTGFLGAGKTTLLNQWLGEYPRGSVAVIVNEFGAVGVDGALLGERVRELVELTGGCICCATQGDLVRALADLASRESAPSRIFVETSGAASPAGVLRAIARSDDSIGLRLDGIVTVVDATRIEHIAERDLAAEQVGYADVLVLSRVDACDEKTLAHAREVLIARNGTAVVVEAARGVVRAHAGGSLETVLDARSAGFAASPRWFATGGAVAHERGIESVALERVGEVDEERFADWVETEVARFEGRLLRIKGIVAVAGLDARMIVQGVADRVEVTFGAPWGDEVRASRMVLVGFGLDRAQLVAGFEACAVTNEG